VRAIFDRGKRQFILPGHWALHLYNYEAELRMGDHKLKIKPNHASLTPANMPVEYRWHHRSSTSGSHLLLESPEDADVTDIGYIPAIQDLGHDFEGFSRDFQTATACREMQPHRTQAIIWNMLWRLASRGKSDVAPSPHIHPTLQKALALIETRLGDTLRVADIARELDISHNQLTRLFQQQLGTTAVGHIRRQRVGRATHLLCESTMPIKAIAHEVGVPDLQQFNKLIHRETNMSPTELRQRGTHKAE